MLTIVSRAVPPKPKGRRNREVAKPISGLDIEALLLGSSAPSMSSSFSTPAFHTLTSSMDTTSQSAAAADADNATTSANASFSSPAFPPISRDNSIPDFKRALAVARSVPAIHDAARQMSAVVRALVADSFGDKLYARALENLSVLRDELAALEEPAPWNDFVRAFKKSLLAGELGGDRRDFWITVKRARLGLLDESLVEGAGVSQEEAEMVSLFGGGGWRVCC
jgi:ATP-dependent DNA helicase 2 subunit 2